MKFNEILKTYKALGEETRLRLVHIFQHGDFHVNELLEILSMGQSRVSRHLKILYDANILTTRREGSYIFYSLRQDTDEFILESLRLLTQHSERLMLDEVAVKKHISKRKEIKKNFFDHIAVEWDQIKKQVVYNDHYIQELSKLIDHSLKVVELGSGTGSLLFAIARAEGDYLGVDSSPEMIKLAKEKQQQQQISNIEFVQADIENVPLPNNSCSTVVISLVLHHMINPAATIHEAARLLQAGGKLVIHDFAKHNDDSYREIYQHRWLGFSQQEITKWTRDLFGGCSFEQLNNSDHEMFICQTLKI